MEISKTNQEKLERLKKIIETEEATEVSTDQALTRVLGFYEQFVPYN